MYLSRADGLTRNTFEQTLIFQAERSDSYRTLGQAKINALPAGRWYWYNINHCIFISNRTWSDWGYGKGATPTVSIPFTPAGRGAVYLTQKWFSSIMQKNKHPISVHFAETEYNRKTESI